MIGRIEVNVIFDIMNFWLINPKAEGSESDASQIEKNAVYMGWDKSQCPKFYNEVKENDVILVCSNAHKNNVCHSVGIADVLDEKGQCWKLKYVTEAYNKQVSDIIKGNPSGFPGGESSNPWGPNKSIIKLENENSNSELEIKNVLRNLKSATY